MLPWSGEVALWGYSRVQNAHVISIFGLAGSGQKKLQKLREVKGSCQHYSPRLCAVEVGGKKMLAVSCYACGIKLIDMLSGEVMEAYSSSGEGGFTPQQLCAGEPGKLWMSRRKGNVKEDEYDLVELDCSATTFTPTGKNFQKWFFPCGLVIYLPAPFKILVICSIDYSGAVLQGQHAETGDVLWHLSGEVDGAEILPVGVTFSPQHQLILMADGSNRRILALDPSSGSHLQSLPVPETLGNPGFLCLHNELLFLQSGVQDESGLNTIDTLSCFSLT